MLLAVNETPVSRIGRIETTATVYRPSNVLNTLRDLRKT